MGWGIDFKTDIYLSKQDYGENTELVKDEILELEKGINSSKEKILMYAAATPKDISMPTEESIDIIFNIQIEINETLDYIRECTEKILNLTYYQRYLENKKENHGSKTN